MESFTTYIVNLLNKEKLFAPQGGPIILSQVKTYDKNIKLQHHSVLMFVINSVIFIRWKTSMGIMSVITEKEGNGMLSGLLPWLFHRTLVFHG